VFPPAQLALFGDDRQRTEKRDRLIGAMDAVRRRFGGDALQVGRSLTALKKISTAKTQRSQREPFFCLAAETPARQNSSALRAAIPHHLTIY
jgi:hypothetical protein